MPKVRTRKPAYKPLVKLPPLPADDLEGLRMSIAANGVFVPIIIWPKGKVRYVVDGSYRKQIADELGYDCPEIVRSDLTEEDARIMARALNLARRQLNREQKRQIIADQLRETPERSARWIGKMLGVSAQTVTAVKIELQSGAQIEHLDRIVGQDGKCYPSSLDSAEDGLPSVNHERYTPAQLVDAVRQVFGEIDLDPASSREANKVVRAKSFFTVRHNGLKRPWRGRVFLNPPFDDWPTWLTKLDRELEAGRVREAIVVGPANISAFRPLLQRGALLWLPDERPKYYDPHTDTLIDPPFGSLVGYVGRKRDRFLAVFGREGLVLQAAKSPS
jgi:ParB-like chromosome segregation protein Spo0J